MCKKNCDSSCTISFAEKLNKLTALAAVQSRRTCLSLSKKYKGQESSYFCKSIFTEMPSGFIFNAMTKG